MNEMMKEFLVGLGFTVDESSLSKFNKAIASATVRVTALYTSIQTMAGAVFYGISQISEGFEKMGYEYRIIAPAINKALYMRMELLKAYRAAGINLREVIQQSVRFNISLAKTKFAFEALYKSVGAKFLPLLTKQMDVFRKQIYANMPKIQSALEKFVTFIFKAFDATTVLGLRVWSILERVYDFFAKLHKATNGWSTLVLGLVAAWKYLNLAFLATPLGLVLTGLLAILALYDDFMTWKEGGESFFDWGKTSTKVIGALAVALAAIPPLLGLIRIGMVALDTVMNINPWVLGLTALAAAATLVYMNWDKVKTWFQGFFEVVEKGFNAIETMIQNFVLKIENAIPTFGGLLQGITDFFGVNPTNQPAYGPDQQPPTGGAQSNVAANLKANPFDSTKVNPLGTAGISNSSTNQQVHQQTTINVNGASDAASVGKNVAGEQSRVNFNLSRNLKGAAR